MSVYPCTDPHVNTNRYQCGSGTQNLRSVDIRTDFQRVGRNGRQEWAEFTARLAYEDGAEVILSECVIERRCCGWSVRLSIWLPRLEYDAVKRRVIELAERGEPEEWEVRR